MRKARELVSVALIQIYDSYKLNCTSFCIDSSESIAGISGIGLASMNATVEAFISPIVADQMKILRFQEIHFLEH